MTAAKIIAARLIEFSSEISNLADGGTTDDEAIQLLSVLDTAIRGTSFQIRRIAKRERLVMGWCDQVDHGYGHPDGGEEYPQGTTAECTRCRGRSVGGKLVPYEAAQLQWRESEWTRTARAQDGVSIIRASDGKELSHGAVVTMLCDVFSTLCGFTPAVDDAKPRRRRGAA